MEQDGLRLQNVEHTLRSRRPAVDWYFRGAWILAVLTLLSQFLIMFWLST